MSFTTFVYDFVIKMLYRGVVQKCLELNKLKRSFSKTLVIPPYIQGQTPNKPGTREYFYFIDHQGMV